MRLRLGCPLFLLLAFSVPLKAQIEPIPNLSVQPIPLPGGDIAPGYGLFNQFFPGFAGDLGYDPPNAEPHGIINFRGTTAMDYTTGTAMDSNGNQYVVITDIRVYQGQYIGGEIADINSGGWSRSARARGTFVEI